MHQHRLSLVVRVVPNCDPASTDFLSDPRKKSVTNATGGFLKGQFVLTRQRRHIPLLNRGLELPLFGCTTHEPCIGPRFAATRAVIQVCHVQ